ncbi:uncharacterized protein TNCV_4911311 [Trichonephila clavipes]|nr:uncharacterized protein TNCV_4911311 [Trichonephila clavipes]
MDPMLLCPGKGLVLPTPNVDAISEHIRFLLLALQNNEMSNKSPFAVHKALIGIGGEPKSVKRLRSGDLLIETNSAIQAKSFLLAKTFLNSPLIVTPHKYLNSCRGVISEPDLLTTSESEILEGFSDQGVIQVSRITMKKNITVFPTKHLILTFNSPNLLISIKAGYLNCKIRPYIPNPLRCFKCQRFGHSQTSCRGQLTCSRCASVGHSSTDCTLEPKCINCPEPHPSDSRFCSKWKIEKQIQEIKTNKNLSYPEARKLIALQKTNICPAKTASSVLAVSTSSTQANLLMSTSSTAASISETRTPIPTSIPAPSSTISRDQTSSSAPAKSQDIKENSKRKKRKNPVKTTNQPEIEIKLAPRKSLPIHDSLDEDIIEYEAEEYVLPEYWTKYHKKYLTILAVLQEEVLFSSTNLYGDNIEEIARSGPMVPFGPVVNTTSSSSLNCQ